MTVSHWGLVFLSKHILVVSICLESLFNTHNIMGQILSVEPIDKSVIKSSDKISLYALPKTTFVIRCYVTHYQQQVGPYAQYARELIGKEGILHNTSSWQMDSITIIPTTAIDASQIFTVKWGKKIDYSPFEELAQRGFIIFPLNYVTTATFPDSVWIVKSTTEDWPSPYLPFTSPSDTSYRIVIKDSMVIRQPVVKTRNITNSTFERAKEIAKLIQQMHQRRMELVLSEDESLPTNEKSLQWVIDELKNREQEYLQLFLGRTISQSLIYTFYFIPKTAGNGQQQAEILRFSIQKGITTKADPLAIPVYVVIEPESNISTLRDYQLLFSNLTSSYIFYRIPEIADVSIIWKNKILTRTRIPVYQFGSLVPWLPSDQ